MSIGNASLTANATATFGSITNAGVIAIQGSAAAVAKVVVDDVAGFGAEAGVLTGSVQLAGRALLDFASGGIETIAAGASLAIDGAKAFVASGAAIGGETALNRS